jgi:hypothetical protein
MVESPSTIFKTFRVTIQLYPEEFRKRLVDTKNHRNGIQLLCANSDPMKHNCVTALTHVPGGCEILLGTDSILRNIHYLQ